MTPVLPPIEESTCASNVVGIFIKFIPLLTKLATKAERSPIIPPPTAIIVSDLLKFFDKTQDKILTQQSHQANHILQVEWQK